MMYRMHGSDTTCTEAMCSLLPGSAEQLDTDEQHKLAGPSVLQVRIRSWTRKHIVALLLLFLVSEALVALTFCGGYPSGISLDACSAAADQTLRSTLSAIGVQVGPLSSTGPHLSSAPSWWSEVDVEYEYE